MAKQDNEKVIEALLFTSDKPLAASVLAGVIEAPLKEIKEAVDRININLKERGAPVCVREIAGGYELLTLPEYAPHIKKLYKNRFLARLSRPALEVMAIIAYKQPIAKQEVEMIRGVNSDGVYHTLLERKLIKIAGRKESPGRPLLYGTTRDFLQYLGVNSLEDLPKLEEIKSILERDENIENWEDRVETAKGQTAMAFANMDEEAKAVKQTMADAKKAGDEETAENPDETEQKEKNKRADNNEIADNEEEKEDEDDNDLEDEDDDDDDDFDDDEEDDDDDDEEEEEK